MTHDVVVVVISGVISVVECDVAGSVEMVLSSGVVVAVISVVEGTSVAGSVVRFVTVVGVVPYSKIIYTIYIRDNFQ